MKYVDDPVKMQKEIIKRSYIIAVIPVVYSLLSGEFPTMMGLLFGIIISTLILRLRVIHIERSLNMNEKKANTFIRNRYFIEFAIYFVVLLVARKNPSLNFLATAAGLFLIKFTVIGWVILDMLKQSWQKKIDSYK